MNENLLSLADYLNRRKIFIIPNYQRGYIWGKSRDQKNSIEHLLQSILDGFYKQTELFLQGITVCEDESIEIIDGQQRTTAFYLLLQYLNYSEPFELKYTIRIESQKFLTELKKKNRSEVLVECKENEDEEFQDVYYFKKSYRTIHDKLKDLGEEELDDLKNYVLTKIKFLYIDIPHDKAMLVFTMMNGNKALMQTEEIIKAEMLRLASMDIEDGMKGESKYINGRLCNNYVAIWDNNQLRNRYAREWDKWLYWWNRKDVREFYCVNNVMGLLIDSYYYKKSGFIKKDFNFDNFRDEVLRGSNNSKVSKDVFYDLRQLQKQFEDIFNNVSGDLPIHNSVGAIYTLSNDANRKLFTRDYFSNSKIKDVDGYLKYLYLDLPHTTIIDLMSLPLTLTRAKSDDELEKKIGKLKNAIESDNVYENGDYNSIIQKQLLRLNIKEDTKLDRAFDFKIWKNKSLEHIYPKSKASEMGNEAVLVHCLGNLVLLYKDDNSSFQAGTFAQKKEKYFQFSKEKPFKSRHLLHTISVFAKEKWDIDEIKKHREHMTNLIKKYYGIKI